MARDLARRAVTTQRAARNRTPAEALRAMLHGYARHAARDPELFRLTYGSWHEGSEELGAAATAARAAFVEVVVAAQADGSLPPGDPERVTAALLLLALVHGATDLAPCRDTSRGTARARPTPATSSTTSSPTSAPADTDPNSAAR